jgi:hypothetical protein
MHYGLASNVGVGLESRGLESGSPASGCGLSFRGDGGFARDVGPGDKPRAKLVAGAVIAVRWLPDVAWRKRIRVSNRN